MNRVLGFIYLLLACDFIQEAFELYPVTASNDSVKGLHYVAIILKAYVALSWLLAGCGLLAGKPWGRFWARAAFVLQPGLLLLLGAFMYPIHLFVASAAFAVVAFLLIVAGSYRKEEQQPKGTGSTLVLTVLLWAALGAVWNTANREIQRRGLPTQMKVSKLGSVSVPDTWKARPLGPLGCKLPPLAAVVDVKAQGEWRDCQIVAEGCKLDFWMYPQAARIGQEDLYLLSVRVTEDRIGWLPLLLRAVFSVHAADGVYNPGCPVLILHSGPVGSDTLHRLYMFPREQRGLYQMMVVPDIVHDNAVKALVDVLASSFSASANPSASLEHARTLMQSEDTEDAKFELASILMQRWDTAEAHFLLGQALLKDRMWHLAVDHFEEAARLDASNALYRRTFEETKKYGSPRP